MGFESFEFGRLIEKALPEDLGLGKLGQGSNQGFGVSL